MIPQTEPVQALLFVVATRLNGEDFWAKSALGLSITELRANGVVCRVLAATGNTASLAEVYNQAISEEFRSYILVFVHDDVRIHDFYLPYRLQQALATYDLIGMAGNRRYVPGQQGWPFPKKTGEWDLPSNLLGAIRHEVPKRGVHFSRYGTFSGPAVLIDGVFMAAQCDVLLDHGLAFDPQFKFHFYDLDFSLRSHLKGLRVGVWPLALTHESGGNFGSTAWQQTYLLFCKKHAALGEQTASPLPTPSLSMPSSGVARPATKKKSASRLKY